MHITDQILNGVEAVTEEQLRYLAKNHNIYDLTRLDVSQVENFSYLFSEQQTFNQNISKWDVSNGTDFSYMFIKARQFNQPIGNWDVSKGTDFSWMFADARNFNQPIGHWNTSRCLRLDGVFSNAKSFNQPIGSWDVSNCASMFFMFFSATSFNQPIGYWNVGKVVDFTSMFHSAVNFNQRLSWNIVDKASLNNMFKEAYSFKQKLKDFNLKSDMILTLTESNFQLSVQRAFEKISVAEQPEQLKLVFQDNPDSPFQKDFNFNAKTLTLVSTHTFLGFIDENNNTYEIFTDKIDINKLFNICGL